MFGLFITYVPGFIILACLFYYLIKKRTGLSYILFFSSFISTILANTAQFLVMKPEHASNLTMFSTFNWIAGLLHFVYAVTFYFFIKEVLKPVEKQYEFLDDSRNGDTRL